MLGDVTPFGGGGLARFLFARADLAPEGCENGGAPVNEAIGDRGAGSACDVCTILNQLQHPADAEHVAKRGTRPSSLAPGARGAEQVACAGFGDT
jgi:hypothetical protein